jgi:hypothetical protein
MQGSHAALPAVRRRMPVRETKRRQHRSNGSCSVARPGAGLANTVGSKASGVTNRTGVAFGKKLAGCGQRRVFMMGMIWLAGVLAAPLVAALERASKSSGRWGFAAWGGEPSALISPFRSTALHSGTRYCDRAPSAVRSPPKSGAPEVREKAVLWIFPCLSNLRSARARTGGPRAPWARSVIGAWL